MKIWLISAVIIIIILVLIYILFKINKDIRIKAYEYFLKAEHEFMSGQGEEKMNYVIENIYFYLPNFVRLFISQDSLKEIVQKMFNEIKDLLDDGKRNSSTKDGDK